MYEWNQIRPGLERESRPYVRAHALEQTEEPTTGSASLATRRAHLADLSFRDLGAHGSPNAPYSPLAAMAQPRHNGYGGGSHVAYLEHKWLWKLAIFSVVVLATSVLAMFKINNLGSSLLWSVVFLPLWLGFGAWLYFIWCMILNRRDYKAKSGLVPPPLHVLVLNALWFSALLAFAVLADIDLENGFPLPVRSSLLFLPLFVASGLSILAPALPLFLRPTYQQYSLHDPGTGRPTSAAANRAFADEPDEQPASFGGIGSTLA